MDSLVLFLWCRNIWNHWKTACHGTSFLLLKSPLKSKMAETFLSIIKKQFNTKSHSLLQKFIGEQGWHSCERACLIPLPWVQILDRASYLGCFCCWFLSLLWGFSVGSPAFLPPQKLPTLQNSNLIWKQWTNTLSVESATANSYLVVISSKYIFHPKWSSIHNLNVDRINWCFSFMWQAWKNLQRIWSQSLHNFQWLPRVFSFFLFCKLHCFTISFSIIMTEALDFAFLMLKKVNQRNKVSN